MGQNVIGKTRAGKPLVRATKIWAEALRSASAHGHTKPEGLVLLAVAARLARGGAIVLRGLRILVLVGLLLLGVGGGAVALTDGLLAHLFVGARLLFQLRIAAISKGITLPTRQAEPCPQGGLLYIGSINAAVLIF